MLVGRGGLDCLLLYMVVVVWFRRVKNGGLKIVKNGPRVWAFCKIEFPAIQKPVQILGQKSGFFRNPGNRGVGVIWLVRGVVCPGSLSFGSFMVFRFLLVWRGVKQSVRSGVKRLL